MSCEELIFCLIPYSQTTENTYSNERSGISKKDLTKPESHEEPLSEHGCVPLFFHATCSLFSCKTCGYDCSVEEFDVILHQVAKPKRHTNGEMTMLTGKHGKRKRERERGTEKRKRSSRS